MKSSKAIMLATAALAISFGMSSAQAQSDFPQKPITLVVASDPGSGSDITARLAASVIEKYKFLPQPLVVENKPGGSMCVATGYVSSKNADPYYLMAATVTQVLNPLRGQCPISYDDMTAIANLSFDDSLMLVSAELKFETIQDLIDEAKANPETITVGGHMFGSISSMEMNMFEQAAGIKLKYVPFGGGGDPMTSLLGGHVDVILGQPLEALELVRADKVKILGALTEERLQHLPDVPTLKEQGVDVVGIGLNRGILAPPDIPEDARKVLEEAFRKFSETEEYKKFHEENALSEGFMDGEAYGKWMKEREETLATAMKALGLEKK